MVWLPLRVVKVVTNATVRLEVASVVMTDTTGEADEVGAMIDVETTVISVVEEDPPAEDGGEVLVDVSVTVVTVETGADVGVTVVTEVLGLEVSAADESEEAADVPPVLSATLWRFAMAIAMSRSLAETEETDRKSVV